MPRHPAQPEREESSGRSFMQADFKRLTRGTLIYGLGSVLNRLLGFLLLPVFTAYLTPAEYGIAAILGLMSMLIMPFFSLGFSASMAPCYFDTHDPRRKEATVWTAFAILLASAGALSGAGFIWAAPISRLAFGTPEHAPLVALSLLSAGFMILWDPLSLYLRFEERARTVVALTAVSSLATIGASVWLVVGLKRGLYGLVVGGLIGQMLTMALFLLPAAAALRFRLSARVARELLRLGLPMVPGFLFGFVLQQSNKYVLQWTHGLDAVGVYNIGFNLGMAMSLVVTAFQSAWLPFFMSFSDRREHARALIARIMTYYVLGAGLLTILFFAFARPVILLMTQPPFHRASAIVGLVATAEMLRGVFLVFLPAVYYFKEVPAQTLALLLATGVCLASNFLLIPALGLPGAGIALACGAGAQAVFMHLWNLWRRKAYGTVPYEWGRLIRFAVFFMLLALLGLCIRSDRLITAAVQGSGLGLAAVAAVYASLSPREKEWLRAAVRRRPA